MKKIISLMLSVIMTVCFFAGCSNELKEETPAALPAQPEINDPGNPVEYSVSGALTSNMVVQRNKEIHIWGWSENVGEYIYGEFMGEKRYAEITEDGEFELIFSAHPEETKPQTMKIYPMNGKTTELTDILVGDVWFIWGQSNAELHVENALTFNPETLDEIDEGDNIRLYWQTVEYLDQNPYIGEQPQKDVITTQYCWKKLSQDSVKEFSAIGYYFAKEISRHTDIPLGMVMMAASGRALRHLLPIEEASKIADKDCSSAYNAMMHPFMKMQFKGVLFYQGEADNLDPDPYDVNLAAFVKYYRDYFGFDFPFYNCQLSSHCGLIYDEWPGLYKIRCEQQEAGALIDNYYLVTTYDVGNLTEDVPDRFHPYNKKPVGERLAYLALAQYYDLSYKLDDWQCPSPAKAEWSDDSVLITFEHAGKGLEIKDGDTLKGFYLLDAEQKILALADAEIVADNQVRVIINDKYKNDIAFVGYAAEFPCPPETHNFANSNELPCVSFRISK